MSKSTTPKLTESEIINLFCDAVNQAGGSQPSNPKLTLFVGKQMFGKRFYTSHTAAKQAVSKLAPSLVNALKGKMPTATVAQVRKAIRRNPKVRKAAVNAAFERELLCAQPVERRISLPRVALP